ncbi:carotenoid ester lipase precursor [Mycena galopus ATCC 62051]|nr:carotenoid ester lipase precursor [Mycena galopus ATCC 62051]
MIGRLFVGFVDAAHLAFAASPTVSLSYGTFQGFVAGNLTQFLGVPFAQAARFETPKGPALLHGVQNATSYGPACPQQELSLTLNVFGPAVTDPSVKLPVFVVGNSRDYDLTPVVERSIERGEPIIVVTPNYRVTALGFLPGKEAGAAGISNLGLRDQTFALQWVQKYIELFGGDPDHVVVGGVSAGSISTAYLFLDNNLNSNVLFRGIFLQSGPAIHMPSLSDGQSDYDGLVAATNCSASADTLDCLRDVPFDTLMAAVNDTANFFSYRSLNLVWGPSIDGDVIALDPWVSIPKGLYAKIPIMVGMCEDEGTIFSFSTLNITTDEEYLDYIRSNYLPSTSQAQLAKLAHLYPQDPTKGSPFGTGTANQLTPEFKRLAAFQGDLVMTSSRRFLLEHASLTQKAWGWLNKIGQYTNGPLGAAHASDTLIWFTTSNGADGMDALLNFINTLDPNSPAQGTSNTSIFWPTWNTPSVTGPSSLQTFNDAGIINITADTFRTEPVQFLNNLRLAQAYNST